MNHDYAHCLDYDPEHCPLSCFRAELTQDYQNRADRDMAGIPVSYAYYHGTEECELTRPKKTGLAPCPFCGKELEERHDIGFRDPTGAPGETIVNYLGVKAAKVETMMYRHPYGFCVLSGFEFPEDVTEAWNRREGT